MKLTRYNHPASNLETWFSHPFGNLPTLARVFDWDSAFGGAVTGRLATDIHEDKDNYYATFEIPGVKKEDVKVEFNDRLLTVTVVRKEKNGESESSFTSTRSVSVPDSVKYDAIAAKVEDGILTVTLPKAEAHKPRAIEVQ